MAKPNWLQRLGDTMLAAQTTSPTSVTGGDAFGPRAMAEFRKGDVKKAQEIQQKKDLNATQAMAIASSVVGIPTGAATVGLVPTLASEGAGWAGSVAAGYLGDKADQKLGTNWIGPVSGIVGGILSGTGVYRNNWGVKHLKPKSEGYLRRYLSGILPEEGLYDNKIIQKTRNRTLTYLSSDDHIKQMRKAMPDKSDDEIRHLLELQTNYVKETPVYYESGYPLGKDVLGVLAHDMNGKPVIGLFDENTFVRTLTHEDLHAAGDHPVIAKLLQDQGLVGNGNKANVRIRRNGDNELFSEWHTFNDNLELLPEFKHTANRNKIELMNILGGSDEARVRALKIREVMDRYGVGYNTAVKHIKLNPNEYGDVMQLFKTFTPKSIKKFTNKVWGAIPIIGAASALKENDLSEQQTFQQGGTLNPFQKELLNNIKSSNAAKWFTENYKNLNIFPKF